VQWAAREFARADLADHKIVMVLHDHQANPHVHISVRAESKHGRRLNPRKTDLHRWRETFAEKLRERGIDAEASRQPTRGASRNYDPIWRVKAREDHRLRTSSPRFKRGGAARSSRAAALESWLRIAAALGSSEAPGDRALGAAVSRHVAAMQRSVLPERELRAAQSPEPRTDRGITR
jgi:hypothetical protein